MIPRCADLLRAAEVSWIEMILSATWGTPSRYKVLRMSLYAGGGGRHSGLLGVAAGDKREGGERTRGE